MMEKFTVNSQYYVPIDKKQIIYRKIVLFALVFYGIVVLIQCFADGIDWRKILILLTSIVIVKNFFARSNVGYQSAVLNIVIDSKELNLEYSNVQYDKDVTSINVNIKNDSINQIEYSDKLNAIRFIGEITKSVVGRTTNEKEDDWVMYIDGDATKIIASIESNTNLKTIYVDRVEKN